MLSLRRIAVLAAVALVAVGILTPYLFLELRRANTVLADTRATLGTTQTTLTETQTSLGDTQTTLANTQTSLGDTQTTLANTQTTLRETDKALEEQTIHNFTLHTANVDLTESLTDAEERNVSLVGQNIVLTQHLRDSLELVRETDIQMKSLQSEHDELAGLHSALDVAYETLTGQYQDLRTIAGTVQSLEAQAEYWRQGIRALKEERAPLILDPGDMSRGGFFCTGSMEPVLTCLDEAMWIHDFHPEEIVVGATIAYDPGCSANEPDGRGISHRVMEIKVRDGVHYYWPKGDSNRKPDGCWIPEQNVQAYIVEIYKGVRSLNAALRIEVNASIAASNSASDAYDVAEASYEELRVQFCGDRTWQSCRLSKKKYNVAIKAYRTLEQARDLTEQADSAWECWNRNAKESEHPGHIPHEC